MRRPLQRGPGRFASFAAAIGLAWIAGVSSAEDPSEDGRALAAAADAKVTPEDRDHWAFRPVEPPTVPQVRDPDWVRNPIDAFLLAGLEARGWTPAPSAGPAALLRRVHFDL